VGKTFGGLRAVHDVDLVVPPGTIVGLIGPEWSRKTTIVNMITGLPVSQFREGVFARTI